MTASEDRPTFVILPGDLFAFVAEKGLSAHAAWLYCVLLKHHNRRRRDDDVWPSRAVLATEMGLKKPDSVDRHLAELREAGLIVSQQRRRVGNLKTSSKHTLRLIVPRTKAEIEDSMKRSADTPATGYRYPQQRATDTPPTGYELEEVELEELKDSEVIRRTAARFAHDDARHGNSEDQKSGSGWEDPWAPVTANGQPINPPLPHQRATYENWHDADRQIFREHVGERLISIGKKGSWKKGEWSAEDFYNAFRRRQEGEKRWPGKYVETLSYAGDEAVDDWLIDQGLERPEWR